MTYGTRRQGAPNEAAHSGELLTLKIRYKQPDGDTSTKLEFPARDEDKRFGQASQDFRFAAAVASFGMLLRDSQHKGNATYAGVLETATEAARGDTTGYREEFLKMVAPGQRTGGTIAKAAARNRLQPRSPAFRKRRASTLRTPGPATSAQEPRSAASPTCPGSITRSEQERTTNVRPLCTACSRNSNVSAPRSQTSTTLRFSGKPSSPKPRDILTRHSSSRLFVSHHSGNEPFALATVARNVYKRCAKR